MFVNFCLIFIIALLSAPTLVVGQHLPPDYYFHWHNDTPADMKVKTVEDYLKATANKSDMHYFFTGDTQFPWLCEPQHDHCHKNVPCLSSPSKNTQECEVLASLYTFDCQYRSMYRFGDMIFRMVYHKVEALIINGDLTAFGHFWQLEAFIATWLSFDYHTKNVSFSAYRYSTPAYPVRGFGEWSLYHQIKAVHLGLGNHDYTNNHGQCWREACAFDMLDFIRIRYGYDEFDLDLNMTETNWWGTYDTYEGSMAYTWQTCIYRGGLITDECVGFLQLHNAPSENRNYHEEFRFHEYKIRPSYNYIKKVLKHYRKKSVVVNMHSCDFEKLMDPKFHEALAVHNNILALFVAHYHTSWGVYKYFCINHRTVPVIFSGSVPMNNWVFARFRLHRNPIIEVFHIHVNDLRGNSTVLKLDVMYAKC